jgi:hypothetical protein
MFYRNKNPYLHTGGSIDSGLLSAIQNADRRAERYKEEFFVARFSKGLEVISGAELEWRVGECPAVIYGSRTGFHVLGMAS